MRRPVLHFLLILSVLFGQPAWAGDSPVKDARCTGKFPNPITDICWSCSLPFKLGKSTVASDNQEDNKSSDTSGAFCSCGQGAGGYVQLGFNFGFFEPARLTETVRVPYCFPSLGGVKIDFGVDAAEHGRSSKRTTQKGVFYQQHFYTNPLMFWLEVLLDNQCLEQRVFDLAYTTELDPLWDDDISAFILSPDVILFANLAAQAICIADCLAASFDFPRNELFWCAGCQGGLYPLTGNVPADYGMVQASALLTQRITTKLHRQGMMWAMAGKEGQCGEYPQIMMDKTNYKYQLVHPVPQTSKIDGRCCQPFGRSTILVEPGKEIPYKGEDASWQIFRKRDCCSGDILNTAM